MMWDNMEQEPKGKLLDQQKLGFHHLATNGTILAAANFDGSVHVYDLAAQQKIPSPGMYTGIVHDNLRD